VREVAAPGRAPRLTVTVRTSSTSSSSSSSSSSYTSTTRGGALTLGAAGGDGGGGGGGGTPGATWSITSSTTVGARVRPGGAAVPGRDESAGAGRAATRVAAGSGTVTVTRVEEREI